MLKETLEILNLIGYADASGQDIQEAFSAYQLPIDVTTIESDEGATDFVTVKIPGSDQDAPTLGVIGRLGGIGARPEEFGMVSDADGAVVALTAGLKLAELTTRGDQLPGDVIIGTHVCPNAPTIPHDPVTFMDSPVSMETMNNHEIDEQMDAVLTIDATKGNRVHNSRGFAISPTIKEGWILKVSEALLDIQERVTGEPASTLTLSMQDITPYGNDVHHINSILQPATATDVPVAGIATTSTRPVAGSATGANYAPDLAEAAGFIVESAKDYTRGRAQFYDPQEYQQLVTRYGSMDRLQTLGTADDQDKQGGA